MKEKYNRTQKSEKIKPVIWNMKNYETLLSMAWSHDVNLACVKWKRDMVDRNTPDTTNILYHTCKNTEIVFYSQ